MKRRRPDQHVEPYRRRVNQPEADALREELAEFAEQKREMLADAWPDLPDGIEDRNADIWEPLLAIADAAGGHWPDTARAAAVVMVAEAQQKPATLGIRLLADIRAAMGDLDRISTVDLLDQLHAMDTAPWGNVKGEPIDARFLARILQKYDIPTNNTIRLSTGIVKGYSRAHFADAWGRYLPADDRYRPGQGGVEGRTVILNKEGSILNKEEKEESTLPDPEVGYIGNTCRVCGAELWAPGSREAGICGKRNADHDAARGVA